MSTWDQFSSQDYCIKRNGAEQVGSEGYKTKGRRLLRNCLTGTEIRAAIARMAPVDVQLAAVAVPVHARDAAIRVARAGAERHVLDVLVRTSPEVILKLIEQTLFERDANDVVGLQVVVRLASQFLVGFDSVTNPDRVRPSGGRPFRDHELVQILVRPLPRLEACLAELEETFRCHARHDHD